MVEECGQAEIAENLAASSASRVEGRAKIARVALESCRVALGSHRVD
jgi:hypothetical protein